MPALQSFPLLAAVALSIAVPTVAAGTELRTCPFGCRRGYRGWDDNFNPPSEPIMCEEQDRTDKNRKRCYPINKATGKCAGALPNKKGGGDGTQRILCIPPNAPVVTTPAPVVTTPAPVVTTPAPDVKTTPAPDVKTIPAPVVTTPAPPALETCPHECARGYGKGAQDSDAEVCEVQAVVGPKGEVARNRKRCYPLGECAFRKTGKLCKPPLPSATRPPGLMLKTCPYECRRGYRVGKLQGRKAKDTDEAVCEEQDIGDAGAKNRNRKRCYPTTMPGGKGVCPPSGPGAGTARVLCKPPSGDDDDDEEPDDDETPAPTLPPTLPPTENATDPTDSNTTEPESEPPTVDDSIGVCQTPSGNPGCYRGYGWLWADKKAKIKVEASASDAWVCEHPRGLPRGNQRRMCFPPEPSTGECLKGRIKCRPPATGNKGAK